MEEYIQISKINDFLYSPKSLYLHSVYESFDQNIYHETPQKVGQLNHKVIEEKRYSTAKRYIQGIPVYSERFNIGGKIDIYDSQTKTLIERKTRVKRVYDGHKFQLYAQMFCLEEMGYEIERLCIHSLQDNLRYDVALPDSFEIARFKQTLADIRKYNAINSDCTGSDYRCNVSIYRHLSY